MDLSLLSQPYAWHALLASGLIALACGIIGPFVIARGQSFAVHGTSELAFTGAAAGLLLIDDPIVGAFGGAVIIALILASLEGRGGKQDATIGVILAFGLALGVLLLSFYKGFSTQATNILFGNIFGVSDIQLLVLLGVCVGTLAVIAYIARPLLFASYDRAVAEARGVSVRFIGFVFLLLLALTVTAAAQVVGTLLVLSLAITPAASAVRFVSGPLRTTLLCTAFAMVASLGGILISLYSGTLKPSICVAFLSFAIYLFARLIGPLVKRAA